MATVHLLRSDLLDRHGFRHGFATRIGGVSQPPFDSLNLGFHLGDHDAAVRENRSRLAAALGVSLERLFEQRQVHGDHPREVGSRDDPAETANLEGDALIVREPGLAVAARTADCVPILIAHPSSGDVAAVHAGWRGAVAGIVARAVAWLKHPAAELVVAIGPHIRVGAFEIGEDVAAELELAAGGREVVERGKGKPHGDLAALIGLQLHDAGIPRAAIDDVGGCTHEEAELFFSHRRDAGRTGRHLSVIVAREPR